MTPPLTPEEIAQKNILYFKIRTVVLCTFMFVIMTVVLSNCILDSCPDSYNILAKMGVFVLAFILLMVSIQIEISTKVENVCMLIMVGLTLYMVQYLIKTTFPTDWILGISTISMLIITEYYAPIKPPNPEKLKSEIHNPYIKFYLS